MANLKFKVGDIVCIPAGVSRFFDGDRYMLVEGIKDSITHYTYICKDMYNGEYSYFHTTSPMEKGGYLAA